MRTSENARNFVGHAGVLVHPHGAHYFATSSDLSVGDFHKFFDILPADHRILANIDDLHL